VTAIPRRASVKTGSRHKAATPKADAAVRSLLKLVRRTLEDGKAEEIAVIPLAGKSTIADFMVIASGRSQRQVTALAERLQDSLRQAGRSRAAVEGLPQGDWVLVDAGDVIVHLFRPEQRLHYGLEKMWGEDFAALDKSAG
jgi:ribosome-associated protein